MPVITKLRSASGMTFALSDAGRLYCWGVPDVSVDAFPTTIDGVADFDVLMTTYPSAYSPWIYVLSKSGSVSAYPQGTASFNDDVSANMVALLPSIMPAGSVLVRPASGPLRFDTDVMSSSTPDSFLEDLVDFCDGGELVGLKADHTPIAFNPSGNPDPGLVAALTALGTLAHVYFAAEAYQDGATIGPYFALTTSGDLYSIDYSNAAVLQASNVTRVIPTAGMFCYLTSDGVFASYSTSNYSDNRPDVPLEISDFAYGDSAMYGSIAAAGEIAFSEWATGNAIPLDSPGSATTIRYVTKEVDGEGSGDVFSALMIDGTVGMFHVNSTHAYKVAADSAFAAPAEIAWGNGPLPPTPPFWTDLVGCQQD